MWRRNAKHFFFETAKCLVPPKLDLFFQPDEKTKGMHSATSLRTKNDNQKKTHPRSPSLVPRILKKLGIFVWAKWDGLYFNDMQCGRSTKLGVTGAPTGDTQKTK